MPGPLHAPTLLHALDGLRFGRPVYLYAQIGSTNTEARRMAEAGAPEGLVVVAEEQTAGRGRQGRRWLTPPGTAIALSVVLRPTLPPRLAPRLTMLAGVAVAEAVEQAAGLRTALKWPNDVLVNGKKAGGVLVETGLTGDALDYAVLGIGLNVSEAPPPEAVDFPATSLAAEAGHPVERLPLLRAIVAQLSAHYLGLAPAGGDWLHSEWRRRLAWLGEWVVAQTPNGEYHGRAEAVDATGALIVRLPSGEAVTLLAGDVRLRPDAAATH